MIAIIIIAIIIITNIAIGIITFVIIVMAFITIRSRLNTLSYIFNQWEGHTKFQITIIVRNLISARIKSVPFQQN